MKIKYLHHWDITYKEAVKIQQELKGKLILDEKQFPGRISTIAGAVVRTKKKVKPLYISPGHKIGLRRAVEVVLSCCRGYRLTEPVRRAHLTVNRIREKATTSY